MTKLFAKITRRVPETIKVPINLAGEAEVDGIKVYFVTRAEGIRLWSIMANDGLDHSKLRNYEIESVLREWVGFPVVEDDGEGDKTKQTFCVNEWCPFNGAWCAWTRFMPMDEVKKTLEDPEVHPSAKNYVKRERLK